MSSLGRLHLRIETRDGKCTVLRGTRVWAVLKKPRIGLSPRGKLGPISTIRAKSRRRKPKPLDRALIRAWKITNWGGLFDSSIPF